ncbi:MAG: histidine phosphatase family protein [Pyrinomonadaceae bacterium]
MKTLLILRHAKSSWDDASMSDFERPLNGRGLRAAPFIGELMRRRELVPETILSSPAMRARTTAELVQQAGAFDAEIAFVDDIYEASPGSLRQAVAEINDAFTTALLVGHNPGIEGFIRYLTGKLEPMPTAALAVVELEVDRWSEVDEGSGELNAVIRPREEMI